MGIGTSLFLIAVGAILYFAVNADVSGIEISTVGIILMVIGIIGLLISLFAFGYAMIFLIKTLIYGTDVPGFPTLVISVMFFAGVQLLSLGLLSELITSHHEERDGVARTSERHVDEILR